MDNEKLTNPRKKSDFLTKGASTVMGEQKNTVKALEGHIQVLKQNLLFLMEEYKPESIMMTQKIITIKNELDKAVQERMKASQIYCCHH